MLGHEVPNVPFPHVNDTSMFVQLHKLMYRRALRLAVMKVLGGAVAAAAVGGTAWRWGLMGSIGMREL